MAKKNPEQDPTVQARKVLDELWSEADLRGRCWGLRKGIKSDNPFAGTNITIAVGGELVSVSRKGDELVIHEFVKSPDTALGRKVRAILRLRGLNVLTP